MINRVVVDVVHTSRELIAAAQVTDIDAVRRHGRALIRMSDAVHEEHVELKRFLHARLYRHPRVLDMTDRARQVLRELFTAMLDDLALLPLEHREAAQAAEAAAGRAARARVVADYVAGMTDRFALSEHRRLFGSAR
jgi:dGTPase